MSAQQWDSLVQDMKIAVNKVFFPLDVNCEADIDCECIDYHPPFFLVDKCNEVSFGVHVVGEPTYPLTCTSDWYSGRFTIQNAEDWDNHTSKFVAWSDKCKELIQKIRT